VRTEIAGAHEAAGTPLATVGHVPTTTMTAAACVTRLIELGFRVGTTGTSMTLLRREERRVIIPHVVIEPPMLRAILRSAGVSYADFFKSPARSGVYTKTTVPTGVGARKTGDGD
jgi:hypothetical protein